MAEVGEEIVGAYLKECLKCDFVEYNYDLGVKQAECDVVGIDVFHKKSYFCEVATHTGGFLYVHPRTKQPDNFGRLVRKFTQDSEFARRQLTDFQHVFMFWSPVVRGAGPSAKHNSLRDVERVRDHCRQELGIDIELVINEEYRRKLDQIRDLAGNKGSDSSFSIIRFLQIEEKLRKHLEQPGAR
ncbi:MAG: hypothetical protein HY234_14035 [Acidobacteria bacterium]|nr:hypothetical protein [Acidobacteriota bacterium]